MAARNWQSLVTEMTDIQKLVHLAMRRDQVDVDAIRTELLREARRIYESELTIQAARIGCPGRSARLENGPILSEINAQCEEWAGGIANTYNYDLAAQIIAIRTETPTANRYTYKKRLLEWEEKRTSWKAPQIAEYTEGWARSLAQQHFQQFNGAIGTAELEPKEAICPVCQGYLERGVVPLRVALNVIIPAHPNCPHGWIITYDKVAPEECPLLWMGE